MPSLGSGYTFADFLLRLQRSPTTHMAPLYHAHKELFVHRPDMFSKAVMSVSWEKAVALVKTAYYTQPVAAETYRAVLARMLLHNRHVSEKGAGTLVDWRAALEVYSEAVLAHGTTLPTRVTVSTLRLLAAHRQWERAVRLLQVAQVNEQLTKPMLIDAAHACATPTAWSIALDLLMHLHAQEPALLTEAIRALRPPGTDALSVATSSHALLPPGHSSADGGSVAASQSQRHVLHVLNDVVGSVPGNVVLKHELCFSYLSHLVASTTLPPEQKSRMLSTAIRSLQWQEALTLLLTFAEPNLLTDEEWGTAMASSPQLAQSPTLTALPSKGGAGKKKTKAKKTSSAKRTLKNRADAAESADAGPSGSRLRTSSSSYAPGVATPSPAPVPAPQDLRADVPLVPTVPPVQALVPVLRDRLKWLQCAPGAVAALLSALVSKLPAEVATDFVREYLRADALHASASLPVPTATATAPDRDQLNRAERRNEDCDAAPESAYLPTAVSAGRHPVVVQALLRTCADAPDGWRAAVPLLLEQSSAHLPTPTDVLSKLVLAMRTARQPALVVKLLNDHIVPSGGRLTPQAVEALLECVLAHNRACHQTALEQADALASRAASRTSDGTDNADEVDVQQTLRSIQTLEGQAVHWLSALSWATDLQADTTEKRITRTGTGPSIGAVARTPREVVEARQSLSPKMLNLLLGICADAGQPLAALRTIGAARDANKLELQFSEQVRAVLYCALYERPFEAEAIVAHAEKTAGEQAAKPLRQLLFLMQLSKEREAAMRQVRAWTDTHSQS